MNAHSVPRRQADRATHERSPQAVSAVPVGIPRGEQGFARLARFEQARNDIRARFYDQWQQINADMQAELGELDRRYWAGEELA